MGVSMLLEISLKSGIVFWYNVCINRTARCCSGIGTFLDITHSIQVQTVNYQEYTQIKLFTDICIDCMQQHDRNGVTAMHPHVKKLRDLDINMPLAQGDIRE